RWKPAAATSRRTGANTGRPRPVCRRRRAFADRVDPRRYYAQDVASGALFASRDGGRHFAPMGGALDAFAQRIYQPPRRDTSAVAYAAPDRAGELYVISAPG